MRLRSQHTIALMSFTLKLTFMVRNPDWVPLYGSEGLANMNECHTDLEFDVEVLKVNFEQNSMRVRFTHMDKIETRDTDATPFFEKYKIVEA